MNYRYLLSVVVLVLVLKSGECDGNSKDEKKHHGLKKKLLGLFHKRQDKNPEVTIRNGVVIGKQNKTAAGTQYSSFQGIPYAKPPIKYLRLEPPVPADNWTTPYNATYERSICIQTNILNSDYIGGQEDCLYINVYAPQSHRKQRRPLLKPVMFWIYGGGFLTGSGDFTSNGPEYFLDEGIIVVTFNYRLGIFGWFSTGDSVVPGNMGLKDQILALKWVQDNIRAFGGNPKQVTIMGESAGAASVSYLIQSPAAKGLFSAGIMESGLTLCPWTYTTTGRENALLLGRLYDVWNDNTTVIVQRMKVTTVEDLRSKSFLTSTSILLKNPFNGFVYGPVSEDDPSKAAFSGRPYEQLENCEVNKVPVLVGFNSDELNSAEGAVAVLELYTTLSNTIPASLVPKDMNVNQSQVDTVGNIIKNYYVRNGSLSLSNRDFLRYLSDHEFVKPTMKYFQLFSKCNMTYGYRFAYKGGDQNKTGAGHADELKYLFSSRGLLRGEGDRTVSKYMVGLWSNFMKFRNPTPRRPEFNITWTPSQNSTDYSYLEIDETLTNVNRSSSPHKKDIDFWDGLYNQYGNKPYYSYKRKLPIG